MSLYLTILIRINFTNKNQSLDNIVPFVAKKILLICVICGSFLKRFIDPTDRGRLACTLPIGKPKGCCDLNLTQRRLGTTACRRDVCDPSIRPTCP
ncbi:MAG: hypothetical protein LBP59_05155 [Planctomycetaceae bacterium]|nr:hypothetical protein [Planctomycetaceae bacterium]